MKKIDKKTKIIYTYLGVFIIINLLKISSIDEYIINEIPHFYSLILNIILLLIGTPLPFILDLILIKAYGISYILIVPLIIGLICLIHCILIRKANLSIPLWDRITKKNQQTIQVIKGKFNIGIKEIITIRSLPLMPFILGNLIIAKSNFNLKEILIFTSIGSYIYYFILFILTNF